MSKIQFESIGTIKSDFKTPKDTLICCEKGLKVTIRSRIIIKQKYSKGLDGLDKFSHIFIIYFLHKIKKYEIQTYPGPVTIKGLPRVGLFASRSQYRPNPIALRLVKLIEVKKNTLIVSGLDAINGSPVLDIKPYVSGFDRPDKFNQAIWYDWLNK